MPEEPAPRETADFEGLLVSIVIQQEALVNLLERRGLIGKAELLEEIRRLRVKRKP